MAQEWLKDCEVCNAGLCSRIDTLKEEGKSVRQACKDLEQESKGIWSASQINARYLYYTGVRKPNTPRKPRKSHQKTRTTLSGSPHPGDPIVAEYEATIKGLKEKLALVRESKDKQIQELREENQHYQTENSAFRLDLKELKESGFSVPIAPVNDLHLKIEKLEEENERLQHELATAIELATTMPQIADSDPAAKRAAIQEIGHLGLKKLRQAGLLVTWAAKNNKASSFVQEGEAVQEAEAHATN